MTGYGKSDFSYNNKKVTIEIKSLNSKQTDFNIKLPVCYREKETEVRSLIARKLDRGKIDCYINFIDIHTK